MRIIVFKSKHLKDEVVAVTKIGDIIMLIKLVMENV